MSKVTPDAAIESRKADHIRINLEQNVQFPRLTTGLERYRFLHQALPELNLKDVDTSVALFGKTLAAPVLITSMTGGTEMASMTLPMTRPRSFSGTTFISVVMSSGIITAVPPACTIRAASSTSNVGASVANSVPVATA